MTKCETCGKFHNSECGFYCSYDCCLEGIDRMVGALGGTLEQAEEEVHSICGECPL